MPEHIIVKQMRVVNEVEDYHENHTADAQGCFNVKEEL